MLWYAVPAAFALICIYSFTGFTLPSRSVWLPDSLTVIGVCGTLLLGGYILAPIADQRRRSRDSDRVRVGQMANRADGGTLDPFALRTDKSYVFSLDRHAAVAYRCVRGVGLASGDPVGDPAAFGDAVQRFVAHCDAQGWRPAVLGVREDLVPLFRDCGMKAHYLGDEAVIDVASFSLDGRRMRPVRQACNRASNFGLATEIVLERDLSASQRAELRSIAERRGPVLANAASRWRSTVSSMVATASVSSP